MELPGRRAYRLAMDQRTYPPKQWKRRRLFQLLSIPLAKGILLAAGLAMFLGGPLAAVGLVVAFHRLEGFGWGFLAALLCAIAVWMSWLLLFDD